MTHTPGPWSIIKRGAVYELHAENDMVGVFKATYLAEDGANARLIAAAPDLLVAMQQIRDALNNGTQSDFNQAIANGFEAIAKAEGQQ